MEVNGRSIAGLLIDIDGVLYVGNQAIPGAVEAIQRLDIPHVYLTNTTTRSVLSLTERLESFGFPVAEGQILSAPMAALDYLRSKGSPPAQLVVSEEVARDFTGYPQSWDEAEAIVIGDIGEAWSYRLLNHLFQLVMAGAELIALHKSKFWQTNLGLNLDIGAFIAGLEYASGREALIVGKPSAAFFEAGVRRLGVERENVAMIGDDIDSDVAGAQECGIAGLLVKTGKYREEYACQSAVEPDGVFESVAALGR